MNRGRWVFAASVVLALPTAIGPTSPIANPSYLLGLGLICLATWAGLRGRHTARQPWLLLAATTTLWLIGDTIDRYFSGLSLVLDGVGVPDIFWLLSYPTLILAVVLLLRETRLPPGVLAELRWDAIVTAIAATVLAWHVLIAPDLGGNAMVATVVGAIYPLADVITFALALIIVLTPGWRGPVQLLIAGCLAVTLPLDFLQALLPHISAQFDGQRLDALQLVVNALLAVAALHRDSGPRRTGPVPEPAGRLHRGRIALLGAALITVSVSAALSDPNHTSVVLSVLGSVAISAIVIARFAAAVREREEAEMALRYQAEHDQLTGAANRTLLMRRLACRLGPQGCGDSLALIFLDLDGFKLINDTWGHPGGDEVLRVVAERLRAAVRPTDTVARVGGDEFVVLVENQDLAQAESLGQRLADKLAAPISFDGQQLSVGTSIGLLVAATGAVSATTADVAADDLLSMADRLMYEAKRDGGGVRSWHSVQPAAAHPGGRGGSQRSPAANSPATTAKTAVTATQLSRTVR